LSADTSLLPNYALEDTLKMMLRKGAIQPGTIHRILVIGPGLDFADKRDGYDFYPVQTIQPFAMLEAVARLGLGKAEEISVVTADLNAAVNAHVARLAERGRAGQAYTVQLPRLVSAEWSPEAVAYWQRFGEMLGAPVKPLPVPASVIDVTIRAVAIRPRYAAQMRGLDMNVVTQTMDVPEGQGFDLVVATNVLVYYDLFQQALAMGSIAHMMNHGAIFLANHALPAQHAQALEFLGRRTVAYTPSGAYGDDVVVYRRR
jgi:NAD(P)-dependent dehydrogenase (short-subunit alcohol dehydrogenase family)